MSEPKECPEELIDKVLTAATNVHRHFGPGLVESVYGKALMIELKRMGITAESEKPVSVSYLGQDLGVGFRIDILVENCLVLELKCVSKLEDIHMAQVITYLRLLNLKRGFLINFNTRLLKDGLKRVSI